MHKYLAILVALISVYFFGYWKGSRSVKVQIHSQHNVASTMEEKPNQNIEGKYQRRPQLKQSLVNKPQVPHAQNVEFKERVLKRSKQGVMKEVAKEYNLHPEKVLKREDHPGRIEELAAGTKHENGQVVGEEEALLHIGHFEKSLYDKIQEIDQKEFRDKYSKELYWFQRVGNFRKRQKCNAIQKMQKDLGLKQTNFKACVAQFLDVEKEVWDN